MDYLEKFFTPKHIAVIGASRRPGTLGRMFLDALLGLNYKGMVYPVNPKANEINGIKCYPDISGLPETPDLAVILLAKEMVLPAVKQLGNSGIKNIIVVSAGFKEIGESGADLEKTLVDLVKKFDMHMIGPNSMGLFNTHSDVALNATFSPTPPQAGHVGFISQSGALGVAVLELAKEMDLGFSLFVSTGNKADIGDTDVLEYFGREANTHCIILYQEAVDHPDRFRQVVQKTVKNKPVICLKAGRTESGMRAASSHTGSLASSDEITDAFLKQCGVIRCQTLEELLCSAQAFTSLPLPADNRVAVVTNAGGPGILASDALERSGLKLISLSEPTIDRLKAVLPPEAGFKNPVDMIASATHDTYRNVCEILVDDDTIDILFIIIVKPPVDTTPLAIIKEMAPLIQKSGKPFLFTVMADQDQAVGIEYFRKLNIPVYKYPETAARVLGNILRYTQIKRTEFKSSVIEQHRIVSAAGQTRQATITEIIKLFDDYNITYAPFALTESYETSRSFFTGNHPVAVKIANQDIIHKSDLGLVKTGIKTIEELADAFNEIEEAATGNLPVGSKPDFLVQKMIPIGLEFILGAKWDINYGHIIMFGIGGTFVEIYRDIVFRVLPVSLDMATEMINEIKAQKLLDGFRGVPEINRRDLAKMIVAFGHLIQDNPQITEMDINPLIWPAEGGQFWAVDTRATFSV